MTQLLLWLVRLPPDLEYAAPDDPVHSYVPYGCSRQCRCCLQREPGRSVAALSLLSWPDPAELVNPHIEPAP